MFMQSYLCCFWPRQHNLTLDLSHVDGQSIPQYPLFFFFLLFSFIYTADFVTASIFLFTTYLHLLLKVAHIQYLPLHYTRQRWIEPGKSSGNWLTAVIIEENLFSIPVFNLISGFNFFSMYIYIILKHCIISLLTLLPRFATVYDKTVHI